MYCFHTLPLPSLRRNWNSIGKSGRSWLTLLASEGGGFYAIATGKWQEFLTEEWWWASEMAVHNAFPKILYCIFMTFFLPQEILSLPFSNVNTVYPFFFLSLLPTFLSLYCPCWLRLLWGPSGWLCSISSHIMSRIWPWLPPCFRSLFPQGHLH